MSSSDSQSLQLQLRLARLRVAELEALLPTAPFPRPSNSRYARQMVVPSFGAPTQEALSVLSVLIVGAGGLGCPTAMYLAGAGVGRIGVVDGDTVEETNLHRQTAHTEAGCGSNKAASLCAAMSALNSRTVCEALCEHLTFDDAAAVVAGYDVVVDCTDSPGTRYLVNDACVLLGVPLVSGAALSTDGQLSVYNYRDGPCYRCVFPVPPTPGVTGGGSCAEAGVLGPVTGMIGALAALEVLKIASQRARMREGVREAGGASEPFATSFVGLDTVLAGRLLVVDAAEPRFRVVKLRGRAAGCLVCGDAPSICSMEDSRGWSQKHGVAMVEGQLGEAPVSTANNESTRVEGAPRPLACEKLSHCGDTGTDITAGGTSTADGLHAPALGGAGRVPTVSVVDFEAGRLLALGPSATTITGPVLLGDDNASGGKSAAPPLAIPASPAIITLDCREPTLYRMGALAGSLHIPLRHIVADVASSVVAIRAFAAETGRGITGYSEAGPSVAAAAAAAAVFSPLSADVRGGGVPATNCDAMYADAPLPDVHVVCRRGVDSVVATRVRDTLSLTLDGESVGVSVVSHT